MTFKIGDVVTIKKDLKKHSYDTNGVMVKADMALLGGSKAKVVSVNEFKNRYGKLYISYNLSFDYNYNPWSWTEEMFEPAVKVNKNLITDLDKGIQGNSLYRVYGLFKGKAKVCYLTTLGCDVKVIKACGGSDFFLMLSKNSLKKKIDSGEVKIMCIERND